MVSAPETRAVAGPIGMGQLMVEVFRVNLISFLDLMGSLSLNLALLNILLMPEDSMTYTDWVDSVSDAKRKWCQAKDAKP
jgi:hypothetical protein